MPWGNKSEAHNQKGLPPKVKGRVNNITRQVNQEAKRRVQQERPATNQDGNKGKR